MSKTSIRELIGKRRLYLDGGMGSLLQKSGLPAGADPEMWNISNPEKITEIHRQYLRAGADIITANTFGANPLRFHDYKEIIEAGIDCARNAVVAEGKDAFIAMDISSLGKLLAPLGDLEFEEAFSYFKQMADAGKMAGCDLILIETMTDTFEAKAAVLAAKETGLPVICSCSFDEKGKMLTGADPECMISIMEGLRVDAIGINCGLGPKQMIPLVKRMLAVSSTPILVYPNAGLPKVENGSTVYTVEPEEFAEYMVDMANMGVSMLGGCCGTTPEYIKSTFDKTNSIPVLEVKPKNISVISSFSHTLRLGQFPVVVGERINPTGKKAFKEALLSQDFDYIIDQAQTQEAAGAHALDINVGLPGIDESEMIKKVIEKVQSATTLPLQIDTSNVSAMENALRHYNGKPLINSVNGKQENMDEIFPLVAKYGGVVVCLLLDEDGIPEDAKGRLRIADKIVIEAAKYGIPKSDLVMDGLAMAVSAETDAALITLDVIKGLKQRGLLSILGVSNISFGLPERGILNSHFFTLALASGLSLAIINPNTTAMMDALNCHNAMFGYDKNFNHYVDTYSDAEKKKEEIPEDISLKTAVIRGLRDIAYEKTKEMLQNIPPMEILNQNVIPALDVVGKEFETGRFFLPQLLMAAEAAKASLSLVKESMKTYDVELREKFILATVKGDIHDIGKNIVKILLENYGYQVVDLGKDVPPEEILAAVKRENATMVGLSALMTTTVPSMEETIKLLNKEAPDVKVVVGGAVLTQIYADNIGADYYAKDAMQTVRQADEFFGY